MARPLRITSGLSLEAMIERLNRRIRGWMRYFRARVLHAYERWTAGCVGDCDACCDADVDAGDGNVAPTISSIPSPSSQSTG
jgi:hypothetical protein